MRNDVVHANEIKHTRAHCTDMKRFPEAIPKHLQK